MSKVLKLSALGCLALFASACAGLGYMADALVAPPSTLTIDDPELGELELYTFDTGAKPSQAIYFISGSGCASLRFYLKDYFADLEGSYRVFALQKRGVSALSTGGNCSQEFDRSNTAQGLVARNLAALDAAQARFDGEFVSILGVSEGGVIAAPLAAANPEITNLVIIGAGGMTFREELTLLADSRGRTSSLLDALARVGDNPMSIEDRFMGMPHVCLSSMLDFDPLPHLKNSKQRVLLVHGEADRNVPLASAQIALQELTSEPSREVALEVVPDANHVLENTRGQQRGVIMSRLSEWFDGQAWQTIAWN